MAIRTALGTGWSRIVLAIGVSGMALIGTMAYVAPTLRALRITPSEALGETA